MNTGIQDGYNLAWKLALVVRGKADEQLLETYNEERLENAKRLLRTTDRFFGFAAGTDCFLNVLRLNVLPLVAKHIFSFEPVRHFVFPLVSQTGINYRHSSLSNHAGDEDFEVKAGDRLPYFLVDGESIYEKLEEPQFHLLAFSSEDNNFGSFKNELESRYAQVMDINVIAHSAEIADVFGTNKAFMALLRPDSHVGSISSDISLAGVSKYLTEFLGMRSLP